ncbi:hypothetical protein [Natrarchaeobaculum sulfurireducens]|uniref:Uncharacterized protein n=1 Tax=Natrarchaeobaculum sulfurireducens TaxID=2044521 RepID=A0A346PRL4_9EURY|nr:hypothetical protein [Natrarchaeobaculum sulfurireducens]AXR82159.1 hypothetical protein AArcMg_2161 [Natrarchaeobaculum sulfurireducens]
MKRRTVLQSAAVVGSVSLAGCLDGFREHFEGEFQGVVPMEIHSESDDAHNLHIEAFDRETGQQTYDEGIAVNPDESIGPPHLSATDQHLHVARIDALEDEVLDDQRVSITGETQLVLIWVYDDEVVIEVSRGEADEQIDDPEDADDLEEPEDVDTADENEAHDDSE